MKRAILPPTAASRLQLRLMRKTQMQPSREVALLARFALVVADQLAGVVDDPRVLVDWRPREDAETVQRRAFADDSGSGIGRAAA